MRAFKILGVISMFIALSCHAQCTLVSKDIDLPSEIKKGQCYELSDGFNLKKNVSIFGILTTADKSNVEIKSDLNIGKGGSFINQGTTLITNKSTLILKPYANLTNNDLLKIEDGSLLKMEAASKFTNDANISIKKASLKQLRDSRFENKGNLFINDGDFLVNYAYFTNLGSFDLNEFSKFKVNGNSRIQNRGVFNTKKDSLTQFHDTASLSSFKKIDNEGNIEFYETANLKNRGVIKVFKNAYLGFYDGSVLNNQHIIVSLGNMTLKGHSVFENYWGLKIAKSGSLSLLKSSSLINRATVSLEGQLKIESASTISNKKDFYDEHKRKIINFEKYALSNAVFH